jgi:uncharacterized membrane protein
MAETAAESWTARRGTLPNLLRPRHHLPVAIASGRSPWCLEPVWALLVRWNQNGWAIRAESMADEPTLPPPRPEHLSSSLRRNIEVLQERRRQEAASSTPQERLAAAITAFTGSMPFVYLHLALYGAWIAINVGLIPGLRAFDPSFVILAMAASVEAIFLSTFVLISQNRTAAEADKRADLDLQISLLTEHELTTLTGLVTAMAERLNLRPNDPELEEVKKDIAPEAVLDEIEAHQASE